MRALDSRPTYVENKGSTKNYVHFSVSLSCVPFTRLVHLFSNGSNLNLNPSQHSQQSWDATQPSVVLLSFKSAQAIKGRLEF